MALAAPFPAARPVRTTRPPVARPRVARSQLRLTRRGRVTLVLGSSLFLFTAILASGRITADAGSETAIRESATGVVVVQAESLWQIAKAVAPQADPRETVARIRDLNGLGESGVVAGQSIVVPVSH